MKKQTVGTLKRHKASLLSFVRLRGKSRYLGTKQTTEAEAELMRQAIVQDAVVAFADVGVNEKDRTLAMLIDFFRRNACLPSTPNTQDKLYYLETFEKAFGSHTAATLEPYMVEQWLSRQKTWGSTTKRNVLKHLSDCFNWLTKNRKLSYNPLRGVKRPEAVIRSEDFLIHREEYERLLPLVGQPYKDIVELLWMTGARPSEILEATVDEFNRHTHELRKVYHKTAYLGKKRYILLNERAETIVQERIAKVGKGLLFKSVNGNPIQPDVFGEYLERRFTEAGIMRNVTPYSFRHSFAVRCLEHGIPLNTVAAWMGNTMAVCEKHYAHTIERLKMTRDKLPA